MKTARSPYRWLLFLSTFAAFPALSGCMFLKAPEPEPVPPKPKIPTEIIFEPTEANPTGPLLNDATNLGLPDYFRIARIESAEIVWLQGYKNKKPFQSPTIYHLAGIVAPAPGAPGWQDAVDTLKNWAGKQDLTAYIDPKFPYDLQNRQVVNLNFTGRPGGKFEGKVMSLNRMMVRSGFALVDLYSPTSFDVRDWLKDEAHARNQVMGMWKYPQVFQALQQRSIPKPKNANKQPNSVKVTAGKPAAKPATPPAPDASPVPPAPTEG